MILIIVTVRSTPMLRTHFSTTLALLLSLGIYSVTYTNDDMPQTDEDNGQLSFDLSEPELSDSADSDMALQAEEEDEDGTISDELDSMLAQEENSAGTEEAEQEDSSMTPPSAQTQTDDDMNENMVPVHASDEEMID